MLRILLLMVVLAAVWFLWKAITEQKAAKEAEAALPEADPATPGPEEAAETAECPRCRAYVPITAEGGCGREDCPIPELAAAMQADPEEPPPAEAPAAEADRTAEKPGETGADKPRA